MDCESVVSILSGFSWIKRKLDIPSWHSDFDLKIWFRLFLFLKLEGEGWGKVFEQCESQIFWLWSGWVLPEPCFGFAFYQRRKKDNDKIEAHTECGEANKDDNNAEVEKEHINGYRKALYLGSDRKEFKGNGYYTI